MVSIQNTYYDTQTTSEAEGLEKAIFVYPIKSLLPLQLYEPWLLHETSLKKSALLIKLLHLCCPLSSIKGTHGNIPPF